MNVQRMLEHYKNNGERVDEVLFQTVVNELASLQKEVKGLRKEISGKRHMVRKLKRENNAMREALDDVQHQLVTVRGLDKKHDGEITDLIMLISKALEG